MLVFGTNVVLNGIKPQNIYLYKKRLMLRLGVFSNSLS